MGKEKKKYTAEAMEKAKRMVGQGISVYKAGPIFTKGLSKGLGLRLRLLSRVSTQKMLTFVLGLVVFTKILRLILGLAKGSTLRLVGSGLKFYKEDLNMAGIFSPL